VIQEGHLAVTPAIETRGLRKEYEGKVAVEGLDLTVERGEVFGFLGANGAGKTTSVKMLLGLVHPSAGQATILGQPIGSPASRRAVGFLPEDFQFHSWLRGDEFLDLHARLFGVSATERARRIPELLAQVGLEDVAQRQLGTYSKGMLQRIGLAQALVNDPQLVFLDEPTSGLDPIGRRMVRQTLGHLRDRGVTVFLNSHLLSEVELTCTRVAFMHQGRVQLVTDPRQYQRGLLRVTLRVGSVPPALEQGLLRWTDKLERDGRPDCLVLHLADEKALPEVTRYIVGLGVDLYEMTPERMSLEDLFMSVEEGSER
jgi:ABC-2 type transport system ATP-binding protein